MDSDRQRDDVFDRLAVVGKAFASANRLKIIDLLAQRERSVESMARELGVAVTTVSAHLQILKLANVVATRSEGTRVYYRLAGEDVATLYASLGAVARAHSADVERALATYFGTGSLDDVDQISREELRQRVESGDAVVIDVRPTDDYEAGHIPGARSVPFGELLQRLHELDSDVEVVAYCRGAHCVLAHDAVRVLAAEGRRAVRLQDGMLEWRAAGLPVTAGSSR
jgi:rhodanese-related sulfurtransferase